jgi:site-specific DNA recombinase
VTRAAIYTRISSDDEGDQRGVARQEQDCIALCERKGWDVVDIYTDNDISAAGERARPQFQRLLGDIEAGMVDALVAWDLDRLVRKPMELEQLVKHATAHGVTQLGTVTTDIDFGTGDGLMIARIKGAVAADEIARISRRVARKKRELAERGLPPGGGPRPYGYQQGGLELNAREAKRIRDAADRVLAGESVYSICVDWNTRRVTTVSGRPWLPNVLRNILISPRVVGLRAYKGSMVGKAKWPAILPSATQKKLKRIFDQPSRRRQGAARHLLTGLLYCGKCGAKMVAGNNNSKVAYVCKKGPGFEGCGGLSVIAEGVEAVVGSSVRLRLDDRVFAAEFERRRLAETDAHLGAELARDEGALAEVQAMFTAHEISRAEYLDMRADIRERIEAREKVLRRMARRQGSKRSDRHAAAEAWDKATTKEQRPVLAELVAQIRVGPAVKRGRNNFDPNRVVIEWL